jgi:hypothetical protein
MVTLALLVKMEAKPGKDSEVENLLLSALTMVRLEATTTAWFAIRFGRSEYGIFDVFPDHAGRFKHLTGHVPRELAKHALSLLGSFPDPSLPNLLAEKLGE